MSERFDKFIKVVLHNEGGYVNDKDDPGGETKFGISKRSYPDLDIAKLTRQEAIDIYKRDFWNPLYDKIKDKKLAFKLFDLGINLGVSTTISILQSILIGHGANIDHDGIFGEHTLKALEDDDISADKAFYQKVEEFYTHLTIRRPTMKKYLKGWLRRLHNFPEFDGLA